MQPQDVSHRVPRLKHLRRVRRMRVPSRLRSLWDRLLLFPLDRKQHKHMGLLTISSQVQGIYQTMRRRVMTMRWRMSWCPLMDLEETMRSSKARDCQALRMKREALVFLVDIDSSDRSDGEN